MPLRCSLLLNVLALGAGVGFAQVEPLTFDTVGVSAPVVVAPDSYSLAISGDVYLDGAIFKDGYPFLHSDGGADWLNTALGLNALVSAISPVGNNGKANTALGFKALEANTIGERNTGVGIVALQANLTGNGNSAFGENSLLINESGSGNTALGSRSLMLSQGSRNIAIGYGAGGYNFQGSDNIFIGSRGKSGESNYSHSLRMGNGTGTGQSELSRVFISGIRNISLNGDNEHAVCIDSAEQLGLCSESSARFKEDIADLGADSDAVFELRPVRYRYREHAVGEGVERPVQFGLLAEEVAEVLPQLVTYDDEGKPLTVRYEALTPLLLNELKKQRDRIRELEADRKRLEELAERLLKLERLGGLREPVSEVGWSEAHGSESAVCGVSLAASCGGRHEEK